MSNRWITAPKTVHTPIGRRFPAMAPNISCRSGLSKPGDLFKSTSLLSYSLIQPGNWKKLVQEVHHINERGMFGNHMRFPQGSHIHPPLSADTTGVLSKLTSITSLNSGWFKRYEHNFKWYGKQYPHRIYLYFATFIIILITNNIDDVYISLCV